MLTLATIDSESRARVVVRGLMVMGALLAAFGLLQIAAGAAGVELARRIAGPFSHYQTFAGVLLLCGALSFVRLVCGGTGLARSPRSPARCLPALALSLNLTRGSWVALAGMVVFVLAVRRPRHLLWLAPAAVVAGAGPAAGGARTGGVDLRPARRVELRSPVHARRRPAHGGRAAAASGSDRAWSRPATRSIATPPRRATIARTCTTPICSSRPSTALLALVAFVAILLASLARLCSTTGARAALGGPRADLHLGVAAALVAYTLAAFFEDNWADTEVQKIALFVIALPFCLDSLTGESWPNSSSS